MPPIRIDIIHTVAAVGFDEVVAAGDAFVLDGRPIAVIGRDALIKNERAAGRPQDLADVVALSHVE